jgi:hypothetical protein
VRSGKPAGEIIPAALSKLRDGTVTKSGNFARAHRTILAIIGTKMSFAG